MQGLEPHVVDALRRLAQFEFEAARLLRHLEGRPVQGDTLECLKKVNAQWGLLNHLPPDGIYTED